MQGLNVKYRPFCQVQIRSMVTSMNSVNVKGRIRSETRKKWLIPDARRVFTLSDFRNVDTQHTHTLGTAAMGSNPSTPVDHGMSASQLLEWLTGIDTTQRNWSTLASGPIVTYILTSVESSSIPHDLTLKENQTRKPHHNIRLDLHSGKITTSLPYLNCQVSSEANTPPSPLSLYTRQIFNCSFFFFFLRIAFYLVEPFTTLGTMASPNPQEPVAVTAQGIKIHSAGLVVHAGSDSSSDGGKSKFGVGPELPQRHPASSPTLTCTYT